MSQQANAKARAFLAAYRRCANITRAAEAAGIEKTIHYRWLKQSEAYAADFREAQEQAAQVLEDEAVERATIGVYEPTIYQGEFTYPMIERVDAETGEVTLERSKVPVGVYKKSDGLMQFLLRGFKPEKYRSAVEVTGKDGKPVETSITVTFVKP
jgi:hypothetical protein